MLDHIPPACALFAGNSPVSQKEHIAQGLLETCYSLARTRAGNSLNTDDLAQDAAIKAIEALPQYQSRNGATRETFVTRVVRNSITDGCRRDSRHASKVRSVLDFDDADFELDMQSTADAFFSPDQYAEYADTLSALAAVVEDLPQRQKMLLERHYFGAESIKLLAEEFQCTVQTLYQARDALLQKLQFAGVLAVQ